MRLRQYRFWLPRQQMIKGFARTAWSYWKKRILWVLVYQVTMQNCQSKRFMGVYPVIFLFIKIIYKESKHLIIFYNAWLVWMRGTWLH